MQKSMIRTWITSLYGSQPSSVGFACKTAHFGPELQVSMGPRPHQSFCACKTAWFAPEWQINMGSRSNLWFWAHITACLAQDYIGSSSLLWFFTCKKATLGLEWQVSLGPRLYLWFLHAKQRLLDQNDKSLWVQDMTCRFVHVQHRA